MTTARVTVTADRPGVDLHLYEGAGPVISDRWHIGGWIWYFARLDAHQEHALDPNEGRAHVKVITGRLAEPERRAFVAARSVVDTLIEEDRVIAGPEGAVLAVFVRTPQAPDRYREMSQLTIEGPLAEHLAWSTFEERFAGRLSHFDGLDAHLTPGFHLLDAEGAEISYVYVWTAGKGVDMSTHNHGHRPGPLHPAFAEVHWVLANGTGRGGMYITSAPGAFDRERLVVPAGSEHGPFFDVDADGRPQLRENGAVVYPWHSWQGGTDDDPEPAYDVVIPFETTVPFARIEKA